MHLFIKFVFMKFNKIKILNSIKIFVLGNIREYYPFIEHGMCLTKGLNLPTK